jgi:hypothetical protein
MFGFSPKLPITEEDRLWVNDGFHRLEKLFGRRRMLAAKVVEPTAEDFPDPYDKSSVAVEMLFSRLCIYMGVNRNTVQLEIFPDEIDELRGLLPAWSSDRGSHPAGLYLHAHERERSEETESRMVVALRSTLLRDPLSLVAVAAHELGHVILLGGNLMNADTSDHEPLTDLLTVFLGLGIFTANSAARFKQFQNERKIGWSTQRLGYLPQPVFAYALAKFAHERDERKPEWIRHLSPNVKSDCKTSLRWIAENREHVPLAKPIG